MRCSMRVVQANEEFYFNCKIKINPMPRLRSGLYFFTMWREGYDYPADDDEQDDRDLLDRADEEYEKQKDI